MRRLLIVEDDDVQSASLSELIGGPDVTTVAAEPPMMRIVREHLPMLEGMELPFDVEALTGGPGRGFRSLELVPVTPTCIVVRCQSVTSSWTKSE